MKKILHLTLKKKWFDKIASGEKTKEFREIKPYWTTRLEGKIFDEIHFRNGYSHHAPFMRVEWRGCKIGWVKIGELCKEKQYIIELGKILYKRNWRRNIEL